jgi:hypothetical protein
MRLLIEQWSGEVPMLKPIALTAVIMAMLAACSGEPDNPEQRIRDMIAAGEAAVEARSIMSAVGFVANDYKDGRGRRKQEVRRLLAGYIMRNKSIHLLTRIRQIELNGDNSRADVVLYVGMAGVPLADADQLARIRTDLYRFDLSLILEDGDWRVASGSWHAARLADF